MDLKLKQLAKALENKKPRPKIVAVQLPEGLKEKTRQIAEALEKKLNCTVFVFVDPCFGACDLKEKEAKALGADVLVHFGHAPIGKAKKSTVFWPLDIGLDEKKLAGKIALECKKLGWKRVGLGTTIQYTKGVQKARALLEKKGIKALLGEGSRRIAEKGQVLGCNYSTTRAVAGKVDGLVFVGEGLFHAIGMGFCSQGKEVVAIEPKNLGTQGLKKELDAFYRKRLAMIGLARHSKSFAILLSTKAGQLQKAKALKARKLVESKGLKSVLLAMDFLRPEYLEGIGADCLVCTACPRIAFDDSSAFKKPIITFAELEMALGYKDITLYWFEEIV